jgi:hypothetical protein
VIVELRGGPRDGDRVMVGENAQFLYAARMANGTKAWISLSGDPLAARPPAGAERYERTVDLTGQKDAFVWRPASEPTGER